MRTINKADGKIEDKKAATFLPEHVAPSWPPMFVASHTSSEEQFSRPAAGISARIVLGSFRASAEMYLSEWRNVVQDTFGDHMDVELVELAVCDVAVRLSVPCIPPCAKLCVAKRFEFTVTMTATRPRTPELIACKAGTVRSATNLKTCLHANM